MLRTEHRIVAFWDEKDTKDKYFISTLCHDFNEAFQEMVADMGPPTRVVFRATDEGWRSRPIPRLRRWSRVMLEDGSGWWLQPPE
jgi:hypothetical protein